MARVTNEIIDEIKNKNDIVSVISTYLPVIKKGSSYVCLCPFHNDTTPSMHISPSKQIYKCFVCGAGGNVINFVKDYEKISFFEALKKLAAKANIPLEQYESPVNAEMQADEKYQEYYEINKIALNLFSYLLTERAGMEALNYLKDAHIDEKLIHKFKLGYGGQDEIIDILKNKDIDLNKAALVGLVNINNNHYHNAYHERLIFPIIDINNNCIGFSARIIHGEGPKYINTKETIIFNKAVVFYNINNAHARALETRELYIAEGAKDVIAFERAGIENIVCLMGTALTKEHISFLKKLTINSVVIAFDGDEAGRNATYKALAMLSQNNLRSSYITFEDMDPEEYLNKNGQDAFIKNAKNRKNSLEFKINYEFSQINPRNYSDKKRLVMKFVNEINNNLDTFDRYYYYDYLAKLSGISDEVIKTYVQNKTDFINVNYAPAKTNLIRTNIKSDIDNASLILLFYMINDKKYYDIFKDKVGTFSDKFYRDVYNVISAYYLEHDYFEISDLYNKKIDNKVIDYLMNLELQNDSDVYKNKQLFDDALNTLNMVESLYVRRNELNKQKDEVSEPLAKAKIADELLKINHRIRQVKEKILNK